MSKSSLYIHDVDFKALNSHDYEIEGLTIGNRLDSSGFVFIREMTGSRPNPAPFDSETMYKFPHPF